MKAMTRRINAASMFASFLVLAACSTAASPSAATPVTTPGLDTLGAVGPCEMVDDETRAQFLIGVGHETAEPVVMGARECTWRTADRRVFFLAILPDRMDMDSVMRGYDHPIATTVAGKRAAQTYSSTAQKDRECLVFVEVAGAQLLNFQYEPGTEERSSTHAQVCEKATSFAERVVASL